MALAPRCWTGTPAAHDGDHYTLPAGVLCLPTPAHDVPVLVGGHSPAALRRAGAIGDGWLGQQSFGELDTEEIVRARPRRRATRPTRPAATPTVAGRAADRRVGRTERRARAAAAGARGGGCRRGHRRRRLGGRGRRGQLHPDALVSALAGRTVLLTGASRGIGAATARARSERRARTRRPLRLPPRGRRGGRGRDPRGPTACSCRPTSPSPGSARALWRDAVAWRGRVDVVVVNAATLPRDAVRRSRRATGTTAGGSAAGERARAGQPDPRGGPALPRRQGGGT